MSITIRKIFNNSLTFGEDNDNIYMDLDLDIFMGLSIIFSYLLIMTVILYIICKCFFYNRRG